MIWCIICLNEWLLLTPASKFTPVLHVPVWMCQMSEPFSSGFRVFTFRVDFNSTILDVFSPQNPSLVDSGSQNFHGHKIYSVNLCLNLLHYLNIHKPEQEIPTIASGINWSIGGTTTSDVFMFPSWIKGLDIFQFWIQKRCILYSPWNIKYL